MAIHLSLSNTGHVSLKEVLKVQRLIFKIYSHEHFLVKHFAADGETGLNGFHQAAIDKYESIIKDMLDRNISIDQFINYVYDKCCIILVLNVLYVSKSGRNRVLKFSMKSGENCDIINVNALIKDLDMSNYILLDHTSIGKMKDAYPLNLFTPENVLI